MIGKKAIDPAALRVGFLATLGYSTSRDSNLNLPLKREKRVTPLLLLILGKAEFFSSACKHS